jgi:hypothetical protein
MVPRGGLTQHNGINALSFGGTPNYSARSLGFRSECPTINARDRGTLPSNQNELFFPGKFISDGARAGARMLSAASGHGVGDDGNDQRAAAAAAAAGGGGGGGVSPYRAALQHCPPCPCNMPLTLPSPGFCTVITRFLCHLQTATAAPLPPTRPRCSTVVWRLCCFGHAGGRESQSSYGVARWVVGCACVFVCVGGGGA